MFVVWVGSIVTTGLWIQALAGQGEAPPWFVFAVALSLWFTVLFANFAEALAEGRSKAQAAALRGMKQRLKAKALEEPRRGAATTLVDAESLRAGAVVLVEAGDVIPLDGEVIEGVASVDESAITGESAPSSASPAATSRRLRAAPECCPTGSSSGSPSIRAKSFLDRMISMVEGAARRKTPNEVALTILLVALTIVFLVVTATLLPILAVRSRRSRPRPPVRSRSSSRCWSA